MYNTQKHHCAKKGRLGQVELHWCEYGGTNEQKNAREIDEASIDEASIDRQIIMKGMAAIFTDDYPKL